MFIKRALFLALVSTLCGYQPAQQQPRYNILVIHADEHRMDAIAAYGNKDIKTPNIDMLAKEGVMFSNSYCTLPVCTPSRYSLISGMYVHEHQAWSNHSTLNPAIFSRNG